MKRRSNVFTVIAVAVLSGSIAFSSCIGPFKLTNKVLSWNRNLNGDKFVNEVVFLALCIVPIYPVTFVTDALVTNSFEFWTNKNPVAGVQTKKVKGDSGLYTVETSEEGHRVTRDDNGETVFFRFNENEKTWNIEVDGESATLLKVVSDTEVAVYLADGSQMLVPLNESGLMAFREVVDGRMYASR
jgi:hypothetical protein